jgi:hypothetical protein
MRKELCIMPAPIQFSFKDRTTGAPVATAIIPEGYLVNATITDKNANDLVPLHAYIAALSPDQSILLNSNSKGMWEQLAYENWVAAMQFANQLSAQARQGQIQAQQRAIEASRMIAQNSAQMSAGIMDSWNRKMASDSRISQARSEAIRGVNTYQTTGGRSVEVGVTADHVYQNNYGDVYGVSGTAPDQELLNRLNWTEIRRR